MEIAIRELDHSELDLVAGGGVLGDLIKIGVALVGNLACGPICAATGAALTTVTQAALAAPPQPWFDDGTVD